MKKIILTTLATLGVVSAFALSTNPQYTKFQSLKYRDNCTNFTPGEFQSITGCFDGKNRDTLTLFPLDGYRDYDGTFFYNKWIVISRYGTVPSKAVDSGWPRLVYEGDLDGNGRDEFAVLATGEHGCWCSYRIYTFFNKKVESFLDVTHYDCNDEDLHDIARRGSSRGKVIVSEYNMNDMTFEAKTKTKTVTRFLP